MQTSLFADSQRNTVKVTVFVHGSVGAAFWLLDTKNVWQDTLSLDSRYVRCVSFFRNSEQVGHNQILGKCGLHEVSHQTLSNSLKNNATGIIISAFDTIARHNDPETHNIYYTFGHLGLLSQTYRAHAAADFYHALSKEYVRLKTLYKNVIIDIVGHSHGGNVALMLAHWHKIYNQDLRVNDCILLATPIQSETAACAYSQFFNRVINIYSEGDKIQTMDRMSTINRVSYQTLSDERLLVSRDYNRRVYDVRIRVNNSFRAVGHANIWLMGMRSPVCRCLDPLPFVVLVPYIANLCNQYSSCRNVDCTIRSFCTTFYMYLTDYSRNELKARTGELWPVITEVVSNVLPYVSHHILLLNKQDLSLIYKTFRSLANPFLHVAELSGLSPHYLYV